MVARFCITIATVATIATLALQVQCVAACPVQCLCQELDINVTHVTCVDQSLTSIPAGVPKDVISLDLHGNNISSLTTVFLNFTKMQIVNLSFNKLTSLQENDFNNNWNLNHLNLRSNNICSIDEQTLNGLHNLNVLNLANNSIMTITEAMFFGLSKLEILDLHKNKISNLTNGTFLYLNKVMLLDLSYNAIRELSVGIFHDLLMLQTLKLDHNAINILDGQFFPELSNLQHLDVSSNAILQIRNLSLTELTTLDVSWNNLTNVTADYFESVVNLTCLNLDGNTIVSINQPVFKELKNLQNLSMSYMPDLTYLSRVTFIGLDNLTSLFLHHNPQLSFIHKELFAPLISVSIINLSYNNISLFYNQSIQSNTQLTEFNINGNMFRCDCGIEWLLEIIQRNTTSIMQHIDQIECVLPNSQQTVPLSNTSVESLHCSEVQITRHSESSSFGIGKTAILTCVAESFPSPEVTWITPQNLAFEYHKFHEYAILDYLPVRDEHTIVTVHESHSQESYYSQSESRPDRIVVLADGSLYIDYVMRSDAGPYKCIAKNPRNSTEIVIKVTLDYQVLKDVNLWSLVVGFGCAGSFFLLNLIYSLTLAAVRRCVSQRRRERIRQIIESMDQYKSAHTARIKENYNHQVGRIRDQYHYQLGRLREHHQNQVGRMGRMREGASQKMDKLRDNYNNQLGRLKEYSSSQLVQIREKYNNQIDKIKDYGSDKFDKIHEKYKWKQQNVIKLLEMMNLDNCRTVFESECVRTESMILQSDLYTTDVPIHSPIDSLSVSDSEYLTATSSESSRYASQVSIKEKDNKSDILEKDESNIPDMGDNPLCTPSEDLVPDTECVCVDHENDISKLQPQTSHYKSKGKRNKKRNSDIAQSQLCDRLLQLPISPDCFDIDIEKGSDLIVQLPDIPGTVTQSDSSAKSEEAIAMLKRQNNETVASQNSIEGKPVADNSEVIIDVSSSNFIQEERDGCDTIRESIV